jgi:hypothetical protein
METDETIEKPLTEGKFKRIIFSLIWGLLIAGILDHFLGS